MGKLWADKQTAKTLDTIALNKDADIASFGDKMKDANYSSPLNEIIGLRSTSSSLPGKLAQIAVET